MKRCTYCGKESPDDASVCVADGEPLQDLKAMSSTANQPSKSFLRWKPISVSLIVLAVLYWGVAVLNICLIFLGNQRSDTRSVKFLLWGSFWNVVIGGLSLAGRLLMKSGSKTGYAASLFVVASALLIIMRTWLGGFFTGRNPFPIIEALLIWPWLIYAMAYAGVAIQKSVRPESSAAVPLSNRGPATQLGSTDGPQKPRSVG
jgi:hypothetical protein